jgi:dipeptidyl aminopeptidase/acylaminoacyl peptidase
MRAPLLFRSAVSVFSSLPLIASCQASLSATATTTPTPSSAPWKPRSGPTAEQLVKVHRAFSPSPSPDGSAVAFLSDAPGLPQLFTLALSPSSAPSAMRGSPESTWTRLVAATERVQFAHYDSAGRFIFFGRDHGGDENTQLYRVMPSGQPVFAITNEPKVRHNFGAIARAGNLIAYSSNERNAANFDVYVRPADLGEPKRVYDSGGSMTAEDFSPDGKKLLVMQERSSVDQRVTLIDLASLQRRPLTPHSDADEVRFQNPRFSADGKTVFVLSDSGRDFVNVATLDVSNESSLAPPLKFVLDEAHDVDQIVVAHAGNTVALEVNLDGFSDVRLYTYEGAQLRPAAKVDLPRGVAGPIELTEDGRSLLFSFSRASSPNEIWRVDVASGHATRITESDHAGLDDAALVEPAVERFKSFDGLEIPVFVFRPKDLAAGARAPAIVYVHGGPESQFEATFNPNVQYLVGHGYIVVAPNVRGSTGYGKAYAHKDDVALRENSVRDLAELNRWMRARADVMPDRIAVMGGSYGGYMTLAAITLYPDLWAAACETVGIANFRTFLEQTKSYRRALREAEYGELEKDGALLDRISPIHQVNAIKAPLMVVHGANDPRVPVNEAEQIVSALRARGQKVEYLRFPNEGHGVFRAENRIVYYQKQVDFFDSVMAKP